MRPRSLAYPFGEVDHAVSAAAATQYQLAVTTVHRALGTAEDRMRLPRLDMYYFRHPRALERWNTPGFRRRIWLRRQARRARAVLEHVGGRR